MGLINYAAVDGIATITLNRPDSLNSMTAALMHELSDAFAKVDADTSVRVVVVTGAGRGFCSGADLSTVRPAEPQEATTNGTDANSMDDAFNPAMRAVANCPVPTIARVNGPAAGGGFGLALACDITIAARSAFFVATFGPRLGIVPDLGTTWQLPMRVGMARARGIAMLGGRIEAEEAEACGLIWQVVDDDQLDAAVADVADRFKRTSPKAMTRIRSALQAAEQNTFSEQLDLEMEHQSVLIPANMIEGAAAFVEGREPEFGPER